MRLWGTFTIVTVRRFRLIEPENTTGISSQQLPSWLLSIIFKQTGHAQFNISKHQPWWIFLPSFKIIQLLNSGRSFFCWITKAETFHVVGLMPVVLSKFPPIMLQNVGPFYFTFDLAIVAVVVSFTFIPFLGKMAKSIYWLEHTLYFAFSTLTFSYLCCWPHQIGNMFMIRIYTELDFVALVGSLFGCLAIFLKPAATRPRLAISNTDNGNLWMTMGLCNFNFW